MKTKYMGFNANDKVIVNSTQELYGDIGIVERGSIGTVVCFPPVVRKTSRFNYFALVDFGIYKYMNASGSECIGNKRAAVYIDNLFKVK